MFTDIDMLDRMKNGWKGGKPFTACGNGSIPAATANIRRVLPEWTKRYEIETVCDAGAGDLRWRDGMSWDVDFTAYDLVPRAAGVKLWDITRESLPLCDLILCRMVLNHIQPRVEQTLELFKISGRYLAATQYRGDALPQRSKQFARLDLRRWLGEPLEAEPDGLDEHCTLALWRLNAV